MKTVVFDLDGTLADTSGDLIAAANASFERLGHGALLDPVADAGTAFRGGRAMLRLGLERAGALDEATVDAAYPDLLDWYGENIDVFTTMYPGSVDAVDALRSAGYKVSVCTNKPEGLAETLLQRLGASSESLPWSQPLVGDLILTWAMDRDSDRIAVSPASLRQFGLDRQLTQASLATQAERNALAVLRTIRQGQHGPITALSCDNHLMASALLYPELWNQLEQQAGDELVVAVPHRDEIWYVAASDHDAVDALRAELAGYSAPDNHGLSGLLFVREEGEWEVYNDR